jgi:hypothetical protein
MSVSTDIFFEVFRSASDHVSWEKQIQFATLQGLTSPLIQRQWIDALRFLQRELGEGLFENMRPESPTREDDYGESFLENRRSD